MNKFLGVLVLLLACHTAGAHPSVGIVQDSRGNVFYTDMKQVWKISPGGQKSVAVPDVHTHELYIDAEDNLYGEHLWYEGDDTKRWGHRVWCLRRDGTVVDVIPAREGFLTGYSFVRDRAGNMYWAERAPQTVIKKRSPGGAITTHATADFRDVGWMTATADGHLYLIDSGNLRHITPGGKVTTVARGLSGQRLAPAAASSRHYHMGLYVDNARNVYVAVAGERRILKVLPDGRRSVVDRSPEGWSPSGCMIDRSGRLWVLEFSPTNEMRARRAGGGGERIF